MYHSPYLTKDLCSNSQLPLSRFPLDDGYACLARLQLGTDIINDGITAKDLGFDIGCNFEAVMISLPHALILSELPDLQSRNGTMRAREWMPSN